MFFKWRVVATWAFFSVYQSLVFFYFVTSSSHTSVDPSGKMFGLMDIGTMTYTCVVVTVNLRLLMNCNSITRWHYISTGGSIALWFIFVFIYCFVESSVGLLSLSYNHCLPLLISNLPSNFKMLTFFFLMQRSVYQVIYVLMSTLYFYMILLLVPIVALFGDFVYQG